MPIVIGQKTKEIETIDPITDVIQEEDSIEGIEHQDAKPYDPVIEGHKNQIAFDKAATYLGMIIIFVYLGIISIAFLLQLGGLCISCYPPFIERFETLVLLIIGFFFGTRLITQYIPRK